MDARSFDNYLLILKDDEGNDFYDLIRSIRFPENPLDVLYVAHQYSGEEWTKLSYLYYGTINLYWLILAFNNIDNPFQKYDNGKTLKIPKPEIVKDILTKLRANYLK